MKEKMVYFVLKFIYLIALVAAATPSQAGFFQPKIPNKLK